MELAGKKIVLGLTGGIACYKSAEFTRALIKAGAEVHVVMTQNSTQFITPVTMQGLSGNPVYADQWDARVLNNMAHIALARDADVFVIAPCTANFMATLAHGLADDDFHVLPDGGVLRQLPGQQLRIDQDARQRVVDFVGHAGGHPSQ